MTDELSDAVRAERDRLAKTLATRTAQLEAVTREFEQFTHSISHDLRAPLRALEGFAQILSEDYADKLDADGKRCIEILSSSAHKATLLIEDLLLLSRTCRKPLTPVMCDLREFAVAKIADLEAEGIKARFKIDELPKIWADPDALRAILDQLLRNAVKFSSKAPEPLVEIGGQDESSRTLFFVRDNGVGFDPKFAHRLFGVFQRLHPDDAFPGRGIGLAIVQRLVNRNSGKVWAEGRINAGATFYVAFPHPERS